MTRFTRLAAALAIVTMVACSGMKISSDHDSSVDFSSYATWDWYPETRKKTGDPRIDDPKLHERISGAVEQQLAADGFDRNTESPDFFVAYHAAIGDMLNVQVINNYYGYAYYPTHMGVWSAAATVA